MALCARNMQVQTLSSIQIEKHTTASNLETSAKAEGGQIHLNFVTAI